jgi:hypothetical protein
VNYEAYRFRRAHEDAPVIFRDRYPRELAHMKTRLKAWMAKTGNDPIKAALCLEATEQWSHTKTLVLAAAVDLMAEEASAS